MLRQGNETKKRGRSSFPYKLVSPAVQLRLHAVVHNVQIIGEATYKLSAEFKQSHPETPWSMIEKMRHILVHDYYQVNNDILWTVITDDIPTLKEQINAYLTDIEAK